MVVREQAGVDEAGQGRRSVRQRRLPGGRKNKVTVRLSDDEMTAIEDRADVAGISVPRLLVESALAGDARTASERRALINELLGARRLVAAVGNNLNQLTRHANATGELPPELSATLHAAARAIGRIETVTANFGGPNGSQR